MPCQCCEKKPYVRVTFALRVTRISLPCIRILLFSVQRNAKTAERGTDMGIFLASLGITVALGAGVFFLIKKFDK